MAKQSEVKSDYIKKETMLVFVLVALVFGFFGGVGFSVYKTGSGSSMPPPAPQQQTQANQGTSVELANRIFALERETKANPENLEAWIQLANSYFDSSNYAKAIEAYQKSLALDPQNPNVWTDMGVMYRRNNQPRKAIEAFEKAIEVDPRHEVSRFNKGIVLMHDLNDLKGAMEAWEELVEVNPLATASNGQSVDAMIQKFKQQSSTP
jgi:cytochrome c-type biogenesis protein CcmH/NrfG